MNEEIFSIKLDTRGMQFLKKTKNLVPYLFWVSVIISVSAFLMLLPSVRSLLTAPDLSPIQARVEAYAGLVYTVVFALVFPFQTYYYYMFVRKASRSYDRGDGTAFNEAFRLLFLNAVMMMITYTMNLLFFLLLGYFVLIR